MSDQIQFQEGAAYEKMMGVWSRSVGEVFIEWVDPPANALCGRWLR